MTQTIKIFGILLIILVGQIVNGQVDNLSKNSKLFDDEQSRFESELKTNKDSAEVYWKHANVTANFTFIAQKDAWKFYKRAIEIDSSKVIYFIDYGKYLHETIRAFDAATDIYNKGLRLFPDNKELNNGFDPFTNKQNGTETKYKTNC